MTTCTNLVHPYVHTGPGELCGREAAYIVEVNDPLTGRAARGPAHDGLPTDEDDMSELEILPEGYLGTSYSVRLPNEYDVIGSFEVLPGDGGFLACGNRKPVATEREVIAQVIDKEIKHLQNRIRRLEVAREEGRPDDAA